VVGAHEALWSVEKSRYSRLVGFNTESKSSGKSAVQLPEVLPNLSPIVLSMTTAVAESHHQIKSGPRDLIATRHSRNWRLCRDG
jgi:hypothetical protein